MTREQERDLVNRAQSGSVAAFEQIVQHYQDRLLRFLMLRGLQRADAEDAAQSAFVNAWQNLPGYQPRWRFSTWLYTIARRCAIQRTDLETGTLDPETAGDSLDPTLASQLQDNVWAVARNHLEPPAFQALWLHHGEGFSGREVARIMDRSSVWVRVNLHRARQRLQRIFAGDEPMVEQHEH